MTFKETYSNTSNNSYDYDRPEKSRHGSHHDLRHNSHDNYPPQSQYPQYQGAGGGDEVLDNRIYVGGVPQWMQDNDLNEYFAKYGDVEHAVVIDKSNDQGPNRYGFVTFKAGSVATVKKLLYEIDPAELTVTGGRTLTLGPARQKHWGRPGGWHHGGRYHHDGQGDRPRRPHQQSWGRRGDHRAPGDGHHHAYRKKEERPRTMSERESGKDCVRTDQLYHQAHLPETSVVPPAHIPFGDMSHPMMMSQPSSVPYPGYPDSSAANMYPSPYFATLPPNLGYMEYYQDQMMTMPAQYYSQTYAGMYYPVMYPPAPGYFNQQQPLYPPQYLPQQPLENMSDSGFHDLTGGNTSLFYQDTSVYPQMMPQEMMSPGQDHRAPECEVSPILNMSSILNTGAGGPEPGQYPGGQPGAPGELGGRTRCFNTPYKQFAPFTSGHHLDPMGNKFPFRGPGKGGRRYSQSQDDALAGGFMRNDARGESIIQPPTNDVNENQKRDPMITKRLENQPDILQDSLKTLTIQ